MTKAKIKKERTSSMGAGKIILIVCSSLVAAMLLFTLITALVKPKANLDFVNPRSVQVIVSGGYSYTQGRDGSTIELISDSAVEGGKERYDSFMSSYRGAKFSLLSGILDNVWFPSIKLTENPNYDKDDPKDEDEYKRFAVADINALAGTSEKPLIVFKYDDGVERSYTVKGKTMKYDMVYFFIHDSLNQIDSYTLYLVDAQSMRTDNYEYFTYELTVYGRVSKMMNTITDIKDNM